MSFIYTLPRSQAQRDEPFFRMQAEGLLACAMSSLKNPGLEDWRRITSPQRGTLLRCEDGKGGLLACCLLTPFRGRVWEFDFSTFRASARLAPVLARGCFTWIFAHTSCAGLVGLCPAPNRHAWRLAEASGFSVLGRLPKACHHARKQGHVDGVFVLCTPQSLRAALPSPGPAQLTMP